MPAGQAARPGAILLAQLKRDRRVHKSAQFLLEIDELMHLLESPIFLHLRLQMLTDDKLYEIVHELLTLLPNSDGFHQFSVRMGCVSLNKRLYTDRQRGGGAGARGGGGPGKGCAV